MTEWSKRIFNIPTSLPEVKISAPKLSSSRFFKVKSVHFSKWEVKRALSFNQSEEELKRKRKVDYA